MLLGRFWNAFVMIMGDIVMILKCCLYGFEMLLGKVSGCFLGFVWPGF